MQENTMLNDLAALRDIQNCKDLFTKRAKVVDYIKFTKSSKINKVKLTNEVRKMTTLVKLDFFIWNVFLVGDGNKVIAA